MTNSRHLGPIQAGDDETICLICDRRFASIDALAQHGGWDLITGQLREARSNIRHRIPEEDADDRALVDAIGETCREAADRIEALEAEVKDLRASVAAIPDHKDRIDALEAAHRRIMDAEESLDRRDSRVWRIALIALATNDA